MTFIPATNCARFELVFNQQGQIIENVYHTFAVTPYTETLLASAAAVFVGWHSAHQKARQASTVSLVKVVAKALDTDTAPGIEYTTGLPLAGTNGASELPMNVTVAIKLTTGLSGRSFRGRYYFVGLVPAAVVGSVLLSAVATDFTNDALALISALQTSGDRLAVVSYRHNKANRAAAVATLVTGASVNRTTDSQRRRLPERGQ